ncbi:MAG: tRNA (adenosine(37)-N6)-dimethylallyltransferase MiaA [Bacilli bacterium]
MMKKLIVVAGPTGVGKTDFSIQLAKKVNGEIINGDAYQVYKQLNIGSAKISRDEMSGIEHHLFSFLDFNQELSVATYQKLARDKIKEINDKGKVAILVGGSGYYLKTILYDYNFCEIEHKDFSNYSNEELMEVLKGIDKERAKNIHINNRIRLIRAIESGDKIKPIGDLLYDCDIYVLTMERTFLYDRINQRVDRMLEAGLLDEIRSLINQGANFSMQSMKAIGYKEFEQYLNGDIDLVEAVRLVKRNSRRYAKKQYTWFKNQMDARWIDILDYNGDKKG